ncbi:hypothetical protein M4I32_06390 [Microbacterium sp. LRZ72]|uniref:hypothetical protein n=1 Tax=Microbacterium sp. LRZ72 TaxID=2942481 RepID=UPI0029B10B81|nr:hypothetical protein [Microbacterium sp. LRZ72]MDX2376425.1 hypothetical protein [Microbacterium sp. LRZ72]
MVTLLLDSDRLEVALSPVERLLTRRRGNVHVAREHIAKAMLTDDIWIWLRGVPSPGTTVPGVIAMGTWSTGAGDDFAVVRKRRPSVIIELDGHDEFHRLLVTTRHGRQLLHALRLEGAAQPEDVADVPPPA